MPRILTPRDSFPRRGSRASLTGSRSSLTSMGSATTYGRSSMRNNNNFGSYFSLRRSSINNGSAQSSTHSMLRPTKQPASQQNAVWNIENTVSVSKGPPSLVTSETSSETEPTSSCSSSQSSLHTPASLPPVGNSRQDALQRYYALRRAPLQSPTTSRAGSPRQTVVRRASLQHPSILHGINTRSPRSSASSSFLPSAQIKEEDTWGQFVDCAGAEQDLINRSKLLSVSRSYPAQLSSSGPARFR